MTRGRPAAVGLTGWRRPSILLALAVAVATAIAPAQETGTYTLRIRSDLVVLDVVAVDDEGRFVGDLEVSDFEVRDDGKLQQIEYLEVVEVGAPATTTGGRLSGVAGAPETMLFASPATTATLIFAIDLGSISHSDLVLVREAISEFLSRQELPETRLMLVTTGIGMQVRVPFTNNADRLVGEIDRIRVPGADDTRFSFADFQADMDQLFVSHAASRSFDGLLQTARIVTMQGVSMVSELESQLQRTSDSLGVLASYLRSMPGRKHVIFYSAGYPMEAADTLKVMIRDRVQAEININMTADQRAQLEVAMEGLQNKRLFTYLRQPLDQLNRSQVSVYAIDPRGLLTLADDPRRSARQANLQTALLGIRTRYTQLDIAAPQDYLVSMASGSGGRTYMNSNDIQRGIRQAVEDSRRYYVLAYRPANPSRAGKYRKIEIKSKRDGVSLRHREGYVAGDDGDVIRGEIYSALTYPELYNNFEFEVDVAPIGDALSIQTRIPTGVLSFTGDRDRFTCPVETYAVLLDKNGRWVDGNLLFAKAHQLELEGSAKLDQFRQTDYVTSRSDVIVEPGEYRLVVVVRHGWNARLGASIRDVNVQE